MISAGVVVDGHAHGLGPSPHHHAAHVTPHHGGVHMTFTEPFLLARTSDAASKDAPVSEFLRPLPKPKPVMLGRLNGALNGFRTQTRIATNAPATVTSSAIKYQESSSSGPVNLVQHKESDVDPQPLPPPPPSTSSFASPIHGSGGAGFPSRLYQTYQYSSFPGPYGPPYPAHFTSSIPRSPYSQSVSAEGYRHSPPQPPPVLPPPPPAVQYVPYSQQSTSTPTPSQKSGQSSVVVNRPSFKVPSGREGSMKHRILTRPTTDAPAAKRRCVTGVPAGVNGTTTATIVTPAPTTAVLPNFVKGAYIQRADGALKRVEDMSTEDFVDSARQDQRVQLILSTIEGITVNTARGTAVLTVSYTKDRTQTEIPTTPHHPFFVYKRGWASCSPEKTLQTYGLECHQLRIGDVCISITRRKDSSSPKNLKSKASQSSTSLGRRESW